MSVAASLIALAPEAAFAHAADRGHVMLLPTGHYLLGGALAVAVSVAMIGLAPPRPLRAIIAARLPMGTIPQWPRLIASTFAFLFLVALIAVGFAGSRDPLSNPLPLIVWTVFWVGMTVMQGIVGAVWRWFDPFFAPTQLFCLLAGRRNIRPLPKRWGYWPAAFQFFAFAWFELVHPAPDDPAVLAMAICTYVAINLIAAIVFGYEQWSRRGEAIAAFLHLIAQLGVIEQSKTAEGRVRLRVRLPGAGLIRARPLPLSGALFMLTALGSVSFDGLMRTFFWLGLIGVNPLEFSGRTAVAAINSIGLVASIGLLALMFFFAVRLGQWLACSHVSFQRAAGALVWSIIPISLAYHLSHYLTSLVINGQYALAALSDPLVSGVDLFGTAGMHVRAGVLLGAESAWLVWNLQAFAIIFGHLLAVLAAHLLAARLEPTDRAAFLSQLPLGALMVAYTVFGLWLLSSPTGF